MNTGINKNFVYFCVQEKKAVITDVLKKLKEVLKNHDINVSFLLNKLLFFKG